MTSIFKRFTFDAAHFLPNVPDDHKCKRMHGHTYTVEVEITGPVDSRLGWVEDLGVITQRVNAVVALLDHRVLNDVEGLGNPTVELLSKWISEVLGLGVNSIVTVTETPNSGARYTPEKR